MISIQLLKLNSYRAQILQYQTRTPFSTVTRNLNPRFHTTWGYKTLERIAQGMLRTLPLTSPKAIAVLRWQTNLGIGSKENHGRHWSFSTFLLWAILRCSRENYPKVLEIFVRGFDLQVSVWFSRVDLVEFDNGSWWDWNWFGSPIRK
jgi:hypothetical protein